MEGRMPWQRTAGDSHRRRDGWRTAGNSYRRRDGWSRRWAQSNGWSNANAENAEAPANGWPNGVGADTIIESNVFIISNNVDLESK